MLVNPSVRQKHIDQTPSTCAQVDIEQVDRSPIRSFDPTDVVALDHGFGASSKVCPVESVDQSD